jgi:hypothetical protein
MVALRRFGFARSIFGKRGLIVKGSTISLGKG